MNAGLLLRPGGKLATGVVEGVESDDQMRLGRRPPFEIQRVASARGMPVNVEAACR